MEEIKGYTGNRGKGMDNNENYASIAAATQSDLVRSNELANKMRRQERLSLAVAFIGAKSGPRANLQPKLIHSLSLWVEHGDSSYLEVNNG